MDKDLFCQTIAVCDPDGDIHPLFVTGTESDWQSKIAQLSPDQEGRVNLSVGTPVPVTAVMGLHSQRQLSCGI